MQKNFFLLFVRTQILFLCVLPSSIIAQISNQDAFYHIDSTATSITTLRSVLISQNDTLLFEHYYGETRSDYPYNIKSASKSIISLLIGIAIDNEFIPSKDATLGDYFPEFFERYPDSLKASITIENLLSMQSGLETTSFQNYGKWIISMNWVEFVLKRPFVDEPGGKMMYSTGSSHVLSAILTKSTSMSTRKFAEKFLFGPLNIRVGGWDKDPQGIYMGGNNLALSPDDIMKIGLLVLNKGRHKGKQIVSEGWIKISLESRTLSPFNGHKYGYAWWNYSVGDKIIYFAWGFGGQFIFIIPHLDAVVVTTSTIRPSDKTRSYKESVFDLMEEQILPVLSK